MYPAYNPQLTGTRVQWPESAALAAKTGFPGCGVAIMTAMKAGLDATRETLAKYKLRAAIDCPRMVTYILSSSDKPKPEGRRILLDRFRAVADVLARSHVRLGLEFLGPLHIRKAQPHEFIYRMDEMLAFAQECGSNCGLLLDTWRWRHVHFNDAARQGFEAGVV